MGRLKKYIVNEASFSNSALEKVVKLLLKTLSSKVGSKFYPFGGEGNNYERFAKSGGSKGIGMIYVLDDGRLVRFNWESNKKSSTITSIDVWKDMKTLEKPDWNLDIPANYNIIQSVKSISNFINLKVSSIDEMSQKGQYGPKRIADANKYGIPVDHPRFTVELRKAKTQEKKGGGAILNATKGVKETSTKTEELGKAQKVLDAKKVADPSVLFNDLEDLISMVVKGIQPSLLITGGAGVGKCVCGNTDIDIEILGMI